jgi:hypothetical protein
MSNTTTGPRVSIPAVKAALDAAGAPRVLVARLCGSLVVDADIARDGWADRVIAAGHALEAAGYHIEQLTETAFRIPD